MKNLFVPYELALKLKEKGFVEECLFRYKLNNDFHRYDLVISKSPNITMYNDSYNSKSVVEAMHFGGDGFVAPEKYVDNWNDKHYAKEYISAPLYQEVVDWLREKHNIEISMDYYYDSEKQISKNVKEVSDSYYNAFNKGIEKAISCIKEE